LDDDADGSEQQSAYPKDGCKSTCDGTACAGQHPPSRRCRPASLFDDITCVVTASCPKKRPASASAIRMIGPSENTE